MEPGLVLTDVYLGLGSNLGDKRQNIADAVERLGELGKGMDLSSVYETAPWGYADQPTYVNAACRFRTRLDPFELHAAVRMIEREFQGPKPFVNGPRFLDVDVLLYGRLVIDAPGLTVPHARMAGREFVLAPLAEIAPDVVHPVIKETIASLLAKLALPARSLKEDQALRETYTRS